MSNGETLTESEDIKSIEGLSTVQSYANVKRKSTRHNKRIGRKQAGNSRTSNIEMRSEVVWALAKIKNGKAPGIDDIPIEIWKPSGNEGVDVLWK